MATWVSEYRRKNGTRVSGHWRRTGGAAGGALLLVLVVAAYAIAAGPTSALPGALPGISGNAVSGTVVQVASETSQAAAQRRAAQLSAKGYPAGVLRSNDYRELRGGYWVVYTGPYAGRSEATRAGKQLRGSRVRHITPRN